MYSERGTMRRSILSTIGVLAIVFLAAACTAGAGTSALTGKTWQLTAVTEKTPAFQGVIPAADQPRYTVLFNTDGTYTGQADCNSIAGKYTTSGTNAITMSPAASTLMACADPQSFGSIYAHALTTATTWAVANNALTLSRADGGTMQFAAATAAASPAEAVASAAPAASSAATDLSGATWQLSAITEKTPAFQGVVPPADASKYTIAFNGDGTFNAKADCNNVAGTYTVGASNALAITLGPSTLALCPEGSLADLFTFGLANAASYAVAGDTLTITLQDGGTLEFTKGG
jgi:heat shock protein HslJ